MFLIEMGRLMIILLYCSKCYFTSWIQPHCRADHFVVEVGMKNMN